jgi:Mor family transcriptional regulator
MEPLTKRNDKIYLLKEGFNHLTDKEPVRKGKTYDELALKYHISSRRIYEIVRRYRVRYNPSKIRSLII